MKVVYCLFCLCGAPSSKSRKGGAPFFIAKKNRLKCGINSLKCYICKIVAFLIYWSMILEFKFRNFRSAKDWQILSFEASADKISEEYYCTTINDTKVLKLGILYGANASGKTNVLLALDFIRKIAISPKINKMQPIGFTPFLLDDTTKKECGVFELTFFVNNMKHLYYLEVDNSAVLKETLKYYPGKQPAEIFSRETINGITHIRLGSKVKLNVAEQEKLQVNTLSNMSVVSAYATANFMFPELERVYNYFLKQWLPILLPQTDLKTWTTGEMEAEKENKSLFIRFTAPCRILIYPVLMFNKMRK